MITTNETYRDIALRIVESIRATPVDARSDADLLAAAQVYATLAVVDAIEAGRVNDLHHGPVSAQDEV